jgi:archaemetzincin
LAKSTGGRDGIAVMPVGEVPELAVKIVATHVAEAFQVPADVLPACELPRESLDARRLQYDAGRILGALERRAFAGYRKVVAVFSVDLFIPIFTHVFGEARQGGRIALVSLARLVRNVDGSVPSPAVGWTRAAKVALHEVGHLFDLPHCQDERCLMHFSGGVDDLDQTPLQFCRYCALILHDALSAPPAVSGRTEPAPDGP